MSCQPSLRILFSIATLLCAISCDGLTAFADSGIYRQALQSTVLIVAEQSIGTGVVVDQTNRLVITCNHVVADQNELIVFFPMSSGGRIMTELDSYVASAEQCAAKATVVMRDPSRDLAILSLDRLVHGVQAVTLASDDPEPGDEVHTIGNSGIENAALWRYSMGTVRQKYFNRINVSEGWVECQILETQIPVNPGDSGGPILNSAGELVAINMASSGSQTLVSLGVDVREIQALIVRHYLTQAKAQAEATQLFLPARASLPDGEATELIVSNSLNHAVAAYWITFEGEPQWLCTIDAGQSYSFNSFAGHVLLFRDLQDQDLGCFLVENSGMTVNLTPDLIATAQPSQPDFNMPSEPQSAGQDVRSTLVTHTWKTAIPPEVGFAAGLSWLTQFHTDGTFTELTVNESGVVVRKNSGTFDVQNQTLSMHYENQEKWVGQVTVQDSDSITFVFSGGLQCPAVAAHPVFVISN